MFKFIKTFLDGTSKQSISNIYDNEKMLVRDMLKEKEKPKTIYRWLSDKNVKKLSLGYAVAVEVNGQRISLKRRAS